MNCVQIKLITLDPHLIALAKQAPGEEVGIFLTSAIVNLRDRAPPRTHSPEFKARGALEAISDRISLQMLAAGYAIGVTQCSAPPTGATHSKCAPPITPIQDKP